MTYSHMANATLPSARRGFTSEFGKDQVVHSCYCRQQTVYGRFRVLLRLWIVSHSMCRTLYQMSLTDWNIESVFYVLAFTKSSIRIEFILLQQLFGCCIVKPHEQLVLVSFTYHYASTSNLSTS